MAVPSHDRAGAPSSNSLFTGRPRFTGVDQGSVVVSRVDTQISLAPIPLGASPPGRLEAMNISSPSRRIAVRVSFAKTSSDCPTRSGASEIGGQDAEPGWREGSAIFRPAALHDHTGFARRTGSGRQSRNWEASSVGVMTHGAELSRPADGAMMQATDFGNP